MTQGVDVLGADEAEPIASLTIKRKHSHLGVWLGLEYQRELLGTEEDGAGFSSDLLTHMEKSRKRILMTVLVHGMAIDQKANLR